MALGLMACSAEQPRSEPRPESAVPHAIPALTSAADYSAPDWPSDFNTPVALIPEGRTGLSIAASGSDPRIVIFDSSGREQIRFARGGRGPGELQVVAELLTSPGTIWAYDMRGLKLEGLRPDGSTVRTVQFSGPIIPFRVDQDSADVLRFTSTGALEIARLSLANQDGRVLVSAARGEPGEPILVMHTGGGDTRPRPPARASTGARLALGNPYTYRIYQFDAGSGEMLDSLGRTLAPYHSSEWEIEQQLNDLRTFRGPDGRSMDPATIAARERERRQTRLPFFNPVRGLAYDSLGRLWVVGSANDSVHIDVFADTTFLGRQTISCGSFAGGWGMAADRAAFVCADGDRPVLRMYRVQ